MQNNNGRVQQYVDQLNDMEKITYAIAKEHLESSFDIEKSLGFIEWEKKQESLKSAKVLESSKVK